MIEYTKYEAKGDVHWQWYIDPNHLYRQLVDRSIKPFKKATPGTLVDIGAGDGLPLSILEALGFDCKAVEPMEAGVDLAIKHGVRAEYFIEQAEKFAERKLEFDYLYCLNTIEHMDNPSALVEIMKRVRNFGVVVTDNKESANKEDAFAVHMFSDAELVELFKDFKLIKIDLGTDLFLGYMIMPKPEGEI